MVSLLARSEKKNNKNKKEKKKEKNYNEKRPSSFALLSHVAIDAIPIFAAFSESCRVFALGSLKILRKIQTRSVSRIEIGRFLFREASERVRNRRLSRRRGIEGNRHLETRNILLKETVAAASYFDKGFR